MNMTPIVVMLLISLLGFGLARQSITYPDEEWYTTSGLIKLISLC